jgi:hypothetical protein
MSACTIGGGTGWYARTTRPLLAMAANAAALALI